MAQQIIDNGDSGLIARSKINDNFTELYGVSSVQSFNGRTGVVVPIQADYDSFFLTPAEGNAAYQPLDADLTAIAALSSTGMAARTASNTWTVRTITETSNRITVSNGDGVAGNPTIDISSSYVGQVTITTLGTVSTGTWSATNIGINKGGTGATLSDPGANALWGWDDTDNAIGFWTIGSGLSYDHATHTLSSSGGLTDGSGTTANGTAVDLGGTLTGNVAIDGHSSFELGLITPLASFRVDADSIQLLNSTEESNLTLSSTDTTLFAPYLRLIGSGQAGELRIYEQDGVGTNYSALKVGTQSADLTYTLPTAYPGVTGYVLSSTTGGVMSWIAAGAGGGATTALDNLASVAINTSLISDTDITDDLGSSSKYWKDIYSNTALLKKTTNQLILGTTNTATINAAAPSSSRTYTIPDAGGNDSFQFIAAAQSVTNKTFGPSTTSFPNLKLDPSGAALLTSAVAGAVEVDSAGISYYTHATSERGVNDSEQFIALTASYTLASQTAAQKMFDATSNGQVTVASSKTYFFECCYSMSSISGSSGAIGWALGGTATLTSIGWYSLAFRSNTPANPGNGLLSYRAVAADTAITNAATTTGAAVRIWGIVRVNAGGTLIPQISLGVAAAAVVGANSYFRIWPVGTNSVTNVGNWT